MIIIGVIIFLFGLSMGSFFNVLIYRLPRNESIVFPPSHCTKCNKKISFYDNIPVFSYLMLRGRCRYCKQKISFMYPFIELMTGIMFLTLFMYTGLHIMLPVYITVFSFLFVLSAIDFFHKEINVYVLFIPYAIALIHIILNSYISELFWITDKVPGIRDALIGSFSAAIMFFLIRFAGSRILKREAMGEADIYIVGLTGLILGYRLFFVSLIFAGMTGLLYYAFSLKKKDPEIPFIPFLTLGCFITFLLKPLIEGFII